MGFSGLLYSGIDEIPVSHFTDTQKCWKVNLIKKAISLPVIFGLLIMDLCPSCDLAILEFKNKNGWGSSLPARIK
jgi:hypothetical protein